jgi:hypothetical protein
MPLRLSHLERERDDFGGAIMISLVGKSETPDEHYKRLDFSGFKFPSDVLSIGTLRAKHPELFDKGFDGGENAQPQFFFQAKYAEAVLANMLFCERLIAVCSYAKTRAMEGPEYEVSDFKKDLTTLYMQYGLASGPHHANELIREIERQGEELAKQRRP